MQLSNFFVFQQMHERKPM